MNIFNLFKSANTDRGVTEFQNTAEALLLDVRTPQEYREGHIPDSRNIPLQSIGSIESVAQNKDTPLFVYCYSGARSRQATNILRQMGYTNVTNIGGISTYTGKVVFE